MTHIDETIHHHIEDDIGQGTCMEFLHDVLAMGDDSGEADVELFSNFLVDMPLCQQNGHFNLTSRKRNGRLCWLDGRGGYLSVRMSLMVDGQKSLDQRLFCLTDIQGAHARNEQVAIDEHDDTSSFLTEIGCMFEIESRGNEIVDELPLIQVLQQLKVMMTAQSGVQRDVTSACTYTFSKPDMVKILGSRIQTLKEGETDVTATYTDEFGNSQSTTFHVTATYFPLVENLFNPSIISTGTFSPKFGGVSTGQNGLAGWQYISGIDLSESNYLVIQVRRKPSVSPILMIYDENNLQSTHCSYTLDTKQLKDNKWAINLQDLKKDDNQKLNLSHLYTIGLQVPNSGTVYVTDVFLSDDGESPTAIQSLLSPMNDTHELYFDLQGRPVKNPSHGIYIHQGKQVYVP